MNDNRLICPICHQGELMLKYEAKYVYSCKIDSDVPGLKNTAEFLPFFMINVSKRNQHNISNVMFVACTILVFSNLEAIILMLRIWRMQSLIALKPINNKLL